jgi:hypothetical protein
MAFKSTLTQPRQLMQANPRLGQQQAMMGSVNQAAQFGNSVSSLAEGGQKLFNKIQSWGSSGSNISPADKAILDSNSSSSGLKPAD